MTHDPFVTDLKARCEAITDLLSSRGFKSAYCDVSISTDAFDHRVTACGRLADHYDAGSKFFFADLDAFTLDAAFEHVRNEILAAPSVFDLRRSKLAEKTAKLIEEAKDLGLDDAAAAAFVNPLTEAMKALSENAIEHRHAAE